jgi:hypothetical protein
LENENENRTELQNENSTKVAVCAVKWKTSSGRGLEELREPVGSHG